MNADIGEPIERFKYWAFISYSQRDKKWGNWLHKALETYRVPRRLVGKETFIGKVPRRVFPIFRDREELPVSADLGSNIEQALRDSRLLIVICSPRSAQSRWVGEEIKTFKKLGREDRILALIIDGEPNASDKPGFSLEEECFPEALRYRWSEGAGLSETRTEPIAADARKNKDGKTNAKLKLLAGLLGLPYDDIKQREQRRVVQRRLVLGTAALFALALAGTAAWQGMRRLDENTRLSTNHRTFGDNCATCHEKSFPSGSLMRAKLRLLGRRPSRNDRYLAPIDRKCEMCHQAHTLHEPNVMENRSCSICHQEHSGPARMEKVADLHCASCHNNSGAMEASAQKGEKLPPTAFRLRSHPPQQVVFEMPRPPRGYTQVLSSFAGDHPEFQLVREKARDPDVLRFNHQRHYAADIPAVEKGRKLDCNYCHKTDPEGRYYQRVNFEANCQACHALLFDKNNPQLHIPHGDASLAKNFLRTLPVQYSDLARRQGKTETKEVQTFMEQQIKQLLEQFGSGDQLEQTVFFENGPYKTERQASAATRGNHTGCAFCHEVKTAGGSAPVVTKPVLVDRWMPQAQFNHAKHKSVKCDDCHHASQSRETSDVLMPAKADCVTCHSPKGKVVSECITCHTYHAPPQVAATDVHADTRGSFKQMLLGSNR